MPRPALLGPVVLAAAASMSATRPPAGLAQSGAWAAGAPPDTSLAALLTPNGEMRLRLTSRALSVGFTALGHRRIRRAADSAFAAGHGTEDDAPAAAPGAAAVDPSGDTRGRERSDKPMPLRDVESVRASGDSLLLCFAPKPGPGPAAPPCSQWRRLLVTGLPPADAQRFAAAVRRARARRIGVPERS